MDNFFAEISLLIITATVLGIVARLLRQPAILAYVIAGVLLGPAVFGLIKQPEFIASLSSFGIALLLFLVGLDLNLIKLKAIGKPSLVLGIGQVLFTAGLGYLIIRLFGFIPVTAIYIAIALTFSSTIIIVKLLSEQRTLDSLHGRLAVGMLLVQDFLAIIALILLSSLDQGASFSLGQALSLTVFKGFLLVLTAIICSRWLLPPLFNRLARSDELLLLASVSWAFLFAIFSTAIGFSLEIGAFLAGLSLASLPYNLEISSKVKGLRDFFITIFFIVLGSQLVFSSIAGHTWALITLSLFVLIGNPLIVMILLGGMGYRKRTSFLVGLTVAQISEFSLILIGMGWRLGHISATDVSLVTIIGVITITISTYFITHGEKIYRWLSPYLNIFERPAKIEQLETEKLTNHVVVFGYHRLGEHIVATLQKIGKPVIVVDFNPMAIKYLKQQGISYFYGDMTDLELIDKTRLNKASLVISTNSHIFDNLTLLQNFKSRNIKVPFYATADTWHDARDLYQAGANYVIFPHYLAGIQFSLELREMLMDKNRLLVDKTKHLAELEHRYAKA
ncbi:MAG: cation:proton antiporter [Patescibacteria group bacterium]